MSHLAFSFIFSILKSVYYYFTLKRRHFCTWIGSDFKWISVFPKIEGFFKNGVSSHFTSVIYFFYLVAFVLFSKTTVTFKKKNMVKIQSVFILVFIGVQSKTSQTIHHLRKFFSEKKVKFLKHIIIKSIVIIRII